ncbi:unnamed protein product [Cylicostephanus goldi]|uniref:Uncharacterized protein n=1 Tax=Cylicostephanus goldi TaxID=71465 RepID=A0A3P6T564_CYLGO|nr:unnamed protein product [Cylicostephanus goldi]
MCSIKTCDSYPVRRNMQHGYRILEKKAFTADGVDIEIPVDMCMEIENEVIQWMDTPEVISSPNLMGNMALLTVHM